MRWKKVMIMVGISASLVMSACSTQESQDEQQTPIEQTGNGDLRQETSGREQIPGFLADKPEDMKNIYLAVAQHQNLLEKIPCYCGCGNSANHKDNYDCFIYENKPSGKVVWDDHGTKCGVCLETAVKAINDFNQGKTVKEIRQSIDDKYQEGYAEPTPTPEI